MILLQKIAKELGLEPALASVAYTVFDNTSAYFQGILGVHTLSPTQIVLHTKKKLLSIDGQNLKVIKYYLGDVAILGTIDSVRLLP